MYNPIKNDGFWAIEPNPYGDDLSLNHWTPDSKPLTVSEKRDLIRRIRKGLVSDGFRKSYRAYVHQEQEFLKAQKLKGKSLSFSAISKRAFNDPLGASKDENYILICSQKDKHFKRHIKKLNFEKRNELVNILMDSPYVNGWGALNLLSSDDFNNILQYTAVVKLHLGAYMTVDGIKAILMSNTVEAGVEKLSKIASEEYIIKEQLARVLKKIENYSNRTDNTSIYINSLNFGDKDRIAAVDSKLDDILGTKKSDSSNKSCNAPDVVLTTAIFSDPLAGVDIYNEGVTHLFKGGEDLNFVDNEYNNVDTEKDNEETNIEVNKETNEAAPKEEQPAPKVTTRKKAVKVYTVSERA